MFNYPYLVELLSPKRSTGDQMEDFLDRFAERYLRIMDEGCGVSMPVRTTAEIGEAKRAGKTSSENLPAKRRVRAKY